MNASPANFGSFNVKNKLHTFINFRSIPRASAAGVRRLYPRMFFFSPKDACVKLRIGFHIYKKKGGAVNHPLIYTTSSNCQVFFLSRRLCRGSRFHRVSLECYRGRALAPSVSALNRSAYSISFSLIRLFSYSYVLQVTFSR